MTVRKILVGSLLLLAGGFLGFRATGGNPGGSDQNVDPTSAKDVPELLCGLSRTDGKGTGPAAKA